MKKIKFFMLAVVVVLFTACHDKLWDAIDDLDARVARLEELCKEMNTNITSLQTIVSVIQQNDVITGITPIEKGGKVVGYTISFDKHEPITIYNGEDGKDGVDGENGKDGQDGKPGADGKDGQDGDSMFTSVTYDDNNVYFTLTDGSVLIVPRGNSTSDFDQTVIDNLVNSLTLDKDEIYLVNIGDKDTIIATTAPFPNSKVTWSSSDEAIVRVENGVVEAIGEGDAIVFAQAGTLTQKCIVSVDTDISGMENGYAYVDLGLSVKWATCNVGANAPEEYGDYFAWGEVEPKEYYDWSTYKYGTDSVELTKYCNSSSYGKDGFTDNKTVLDIEDDAASANWGGAWRMPTKAEQDELRNKCTWTWTTQNGVNGYKVVGSNGNSIFLPAAGYMYGGTLKYAGSGGYYWSSLLYTDDSDCAYRVYFDSGGVGWYYGLNRYNGHSVRPVCQ